MRCLVLTALATNICACHSHFPEQNVTAAQSVLTFHKIVAVSDSLTNDEPDNYLALLGEKLRVPVVAEAHGGWTTTTYFRERFHDVAFAKVPADADLCLILIGSNNLFEDAGGSEKSIADAVAGVRMIAEHVHGVAPRARFVLVAPPIVAMKNNHLPEIKPQRRIDVQTPAMLAALAGAYRDLAAREGWLFVDLQPVLTEDDYIDSAHPSPAGNRKIAEALAAALRP